MEGHLENLHSIEKKVKELLINDVNSNNNFNNVFGGNHTLVATVNVTSSGTVAAGAVALAFHFSSDFDGSVNGVPKTGTSPSVVYNAQQGKTFPAISYTINAGSIWIERFN